MLTFDELVHDQRHGSRSVQLFWHGDTGLASPALRPTDLSDSVDGYSLVQLRYRPSPLASDLERDVTLTRMSNGDQFHRPEGAPQLIPRVVELAQVGHQSFPRVRCSIPTPDGGLGR